MNPMFQQLEDRRLLTATLGDDGLLTVEGAAGNDRIVVTVTADGGVVVSEAATRRFGRFFGRPSPTKTTFEPGEVSSIIVNGGDGNDTVAIKVSRAYEGEEIPVTINGGAGDDWLAGSSAADSIGGGDGNDNIHGGGGGDSISGDAGDDNLAGGDGDDLIDGGDGEDRVVGGEGVDTLNGGAGDDLLIAIDGDTTDIIDGGDDTAADGEDDADIALVDADEAAVNATAKTLDDLPHHGHGGRHHGGPDHLGALARFIGFGRRRIR